MGVFSYRKSSSAETKKKGSDNFSSSGWKLKLGGEQNTPLKLGNALNKGSMVRLPDVEVSWFLLKPEVVELEVGGLVQPENCRSWQLGGLALSFYF